MTFNASINPFKEKLVNSSHQSLVRPAQADVPTSVSLDRPTELLNEELDTVNGGAFHGVVSPEIVIDRLLASGPYLV